MTPADLPNALFGAIPALPGAAGNLLNDPTELITNPTLANAVISKGSSQSRTSQDSLFTISPSLSVYVPTRLKDFVEEHSVLNRGAVAPHQFPADTDKAYKIVNAIQSSRRRSAR